MPSFNPNQIRLANNRAIQRYDRIGTKLFLNTLKAQAVRFDPDLMKNAYIEFYQYVFVDSAKREYSRIRKQEAQTKDFTLDSFFLSTWREWIKQWVLDNLLQVIAGVDENTTGKIREITASAIEQGLSPSDTADLLVKEIGSRSRALAIAKTEGTTANNMGTKRSAEDWELQTGTKLYKVWIHSGSYRDPRIAHINAQRKPIPKVELFNINGIGMEFPGDKRGGAGEIINCLCTHSYLSERLAKKRYPDSF